MRDAVTIAGWVFGISGTLYGLNCMRELKRWARMCNRARIAVAYNNKVRFNHSIVEFVQWANALEKDKTARGQVVYSMNKTSLSIIQAQNPPGKIRSIIKRGRGQHGKASPPESKQGKVKLAS